MSDEKNQSISTEEVKKEKKEEKQEAKKVPVPSEGLKEEPEEQKEELKPDLSAEAPAKAEPTGKFKDLIREIENLSTLELAELVKALEERFGVSAAAPMTVVAQPNAGAATAAPEVEEKANFTVVLVDSGSQKIAVIKALREINQELGLKEAKDIADAPPKEILKDIPKEKAEEAKGKLEAAGAKVELK